MPECDECGDHTSMPYTCNRCGEKFCGKHRLPEKHDCPGLQWNDPQGVWQEDESTSGGKSESGGIASALPNLGFGRGGALSYFRGNMTYVFLALMWVTWATQWFILPGITDIGPRTSQLWYDIFTLQSNHPEYVWAWFTSIFAHAGGLGHIAGNSIVIFFFGRLVEEYVGSRDYTLIFLGSGIVAGLGQIGIALIQGSPTALYGASGAALAMLGALTIIRPNLTVLIYFLIPTPIWVITGLYALLSVTGILGGGVPLPGQANVAHGAHLVGLAIGLLYGQHVKGQVSLPRETQLGGGGGRRGGGRGPF
ncbi:rhomboid family intramembrane serine protease [Haloarchaeobius amylolyticus]|uniref:rhomboid family intramembrane serine protease n=1 Tax=Haloarchaeobius amylolyticus TaxID=1198296 RepID=UPI00226E6FBB|nr:rhomboid family intramembrane serine protease [Haloarchaeobius amylolyticus]